MCHIFFIHSSVDGHLGCFHVLAIVNRAFAYFEATLKYYRKVINIYVETTMHYPTYSTAED